RRARLRGALPRGRQAARRGPRLRGRGRRRRALPLQRVGRLAAPRVRGRCAGPAVSGLTRRAGAATDSGRSNFPEVRGMQALYLWPAEPLLSLFVLWLASVVFLWAARDAMVRLLASLGGFLGEGCQGLAGWCREAAADLRKQSRAALLAAARVE